MYFKREKIKIICYFSLIKLKHLFFLPLMTTLCFILIIGLNLTIQNLRLVQISFAKCLSVTNFSRLLV